MAAKVNKERFWHSDLPLTYEEFVPSPPRGAPRSPSPRKEAILSTVFVKEKKEPVVKPNWVKNDAPSISIFGFLVDEGAVGGKREAMDDGRGWYTAVESRVGWKKQKSMGIFGHEVVLDSSDVLNSSDYEEGVGGEGEGEIGGAQNEGTHANNGMTTSLTNALSASPIQHSSPNLLPNEKWAKYATPSVFGFILEEGWEEREKADASALAIQLWFKRTYIGWALKQRHKRNSTVV